MGVFQTVYDNIARLAGDAWGFMVGLLIIVAMLGGLYYTFRVEQEWLLVEARWLAWRSSAL